MSAEEHRRRDQAARQKCVKPAPTAVNARPDEEGHGQEPAGEFGRSRAAEDQPEGQNPAPTDGLALCLRLGVGTDGLAKVMIERTQSAD